MQDISLASEEELDLEEIYKNPAYRATKELCYIDILDEQRPDEKQTITYITDRKNFERLLHRIMRTQRVDYATAGDIMLDVYEELSRKEDYQLMWDERDPTKIIPIEGYINHIVNICIKRYFSKTSKLKFREMSNIVTGQNETEEDLFDLLPDNSTSMLLEAYEYDLDTALEWARKHRYDGNCDLLSVVYVRMIAHNNEAFKRVARLLGISQEAETKLESWLKRDEDALYFLKSIVADKDKSIRELEKYVYGAKLMKKAVSVA